jgi:hypothetical protein
MRAGDFAETPTRFVAGHRAADALGGDDTDLRRSGIVKTENPKSKKV